MWSRAFHAGADDPAVVEAETVEPDAGELHRIHWLAGRSAGERVLDAAGTGGAAGVLLAEEGRAVVAVEAADDSLERTRRRIEAADEAVRAQIEVVAPAEGGLSLDDGAFDTVLLSLGSLELGEALRLLGSEGTLVLTTAWDAHPYLDSQEEPELQAMLETLERSLVVEHLELGEGFLGLVARRGGTGRGSQPWLDALRSVHHRLADRDRALARLEEELAERDAAAENALAELERTKREGERLRGRVERLEERREAAKRRGDELREKLTLRERELREARRELREARREAAKDRRRLEALLSSRSYRAGRLLSRAKAAVDRASRLGTRSSGR